MSANSIRMMMTMMAVMMMAMMMAICELDETMETESKTTATAAQGKCQPPARHAHVVMIMGSCPSVLYQGSTFVMEAPNSCPNWLNEFGERLTNKIGETVKTELKAEIRGVREETNRELVKINKAVGDLQLESSENAQKVERIEAEMNRIKQVKSQVVVAPACNYSKEDIDYYLKVYKEMLRTIGLSPFNLLDFKRIKEWIMKEYNMEKPTKDEILTGNVMDFFVNDMGMCADAVEALVSKIETMWVKKMVFKDSNPDNLTIFVRFTDEGGKKSCFHHAKAMNKATTNNQLESRRLVLDIPPQLESRFAALTRMSWRVRDDAKRNLNMLVHTRIECVNNTIELQVKEPNDLYYHTLDVMKEYPGSNVPGIEYDKKVSGAKKPDIFKFTGTKTPPGRKRVEPPRETREVRDTPRQRLQIGNSTLRGANTEPLGQRPATTKSQEDAATKVTAQEVFGGNFLDLSDMELNSVVVTAPLRPGGLEEAETNGNSAPTLPLLGAAASKDCFADLDPLSQQTKRSFYLRGAGSLANLTPKSNNAMTQLMLAANRSQSEENISKSTGLKRKDKPTTESQPTRRLGRPPGSKTKKTDSAKKTGAIPRVPALPRIAAKKHAAEVLRDELKAARANNPNNICPDLDVEGDEDVLELSKSDDLNFDDI